MRMALNAQLLKPEVKCLNGGSSYECMAAIHNRDADVAVLEAGDVYTAGLTFDLIPIMAERYNLDDSYYYVVAVSKEDDMTTDVVYLRRGTPSIEELWNGDAELKWRTFCDVIHPDLHDSCLSRLRACLIIPTAILFYMQVRHHPSSSSPRSIFKPTFHHPHRHPLYFSLLLSSPSPLTPPFPLTTLTPHSLSQPSPLNPLITLTPSHHPHSLSPPSSLTPSHDPHP
ncbi:hypothetical protein HAZT_HAZT005259 [Hyalella azteca]|uniref:Transferrin-like domain-containing protein n=1 Tax=Hyalella azteca TaxID=294128 RepID=A0A6A0GYA5_HYAAZ|nr:hypothetical protein HAZT_HAZT005259 [Hyalella azteca]